jgi:hypothetical protein
MGEIEYPLVVSASSAHVSSRTASISREAFGFIELFFDLDLYWS